MIAKQQTIPRRVSFRLDPGTSPKTVTFCFDCESKSANENREVFTQAQLRELKDAKQAHVDGLEKPASAAKKATKSGKRFLSEISFAYLTFLDTFMSKFTAHLTTKFTPPLALQSQKSNVTPPPKIIQNIEASKLSVTSNKTNMEKKKKEKQKKMKKPKKNETPKSKTVSNPKQKKIEASKSSVASNPKSKTEATKSSGASNDIRHDFKSFISAASGESTPKSQSFNLKSFRSVEHPHLTAPFGDFIRRIYDESLRNMDARSVCTARGAEEFAPPVLTVDSGSDIHLFRMEDANKLFKNKRQSNLRVVGVSGVPSDTRMQGDVTLKVADDDGHILEVDLGTSYASDHVPLNLLSASLLLREGAVFHLESGSCYFQPTPTSPKIPLLQRNGMFELPLAEASVLNSASGPKDLANTSFTVHGRCFGTSTDWQTWHRRLRHMPMGRLKHILPTTTWPMALLFVEAIKASIAAVTRVASRRFAARVPIERRSTAKSNQSDK